MLRISKLADYGTIVMVHFARHGQQANAKTIAELTHLSAPTVSKLLKSLVRAGLLHSVRGASGGYRLARLPAAISVFEIVDALEEKKGLTECSAHGSHCALDAVCSVKGNWKLISQAVETALRSISLEALAAPRIGEAALSPIGRLSIC